MSSGSRVLIVDDDEKLRQSLTRGLELERYSVVTAVGGRDALDTLSSESVDAVVLDVAMPDVDGIAVAQRMRARGDRTPILMLTARDTVDDRVSGLDAGADDYLVKPFVLKELHARLRALLRRVDPSVADLRFAGLRMDASTRTVWREDRRIELSRTEYALLELFLRNPGRVLSRSVIFERVWGYDFGATSNSLGVYIGYLRRKLESDASARVLHTVRGVGYVLSEDPP